MEVEDGLVLAPGTTVDKVVSLRGCLDRHDHRKCHAMQVSSCLTILKDFQRKTPRDTAQLWAYVCMQAVKGQI